MLSDVGSLEHSSSHSGPGLQTGTGTHPVTQTATDNAPAAPLIQYQMQTQAAISPAPLGLAEAEGTSAEHTPHSPGSQAHAHSWIPQNS